MFVPLGVFIRSSYSSGSKFQFRGPLISHGFLDPGWAGHGVDSLSAVTHPTRGSIVARVGPQEARRLASLHSVILQLQGCSM